MTPGLPAPSTKAKPVCRSVAQGGRRCRCDVGEHRRARQRAAYAARLATTAARRPVPSTVTSPPAAPAPTLDDIRRAVADVRRVLDAGDAVTVSTPTAAGLAAEAKVREVGAMIAAAAVDRITAAETAIRADMLAAGYPRGVDDYIAQLEADKARVEADIDAAVADLGGPTGYLAFYRSEKLPDNQDDHSVERERLRAAAARRNAGIRQRADIVERLAAAKAGQDPWSTRLAAAPAEAYRAVLADLRPMGPPGEGVVTAVGSQKTKTKTLTAAVDNYPTDMIRRSNDHPIPLFVRHAPHRAHYAHGRVIRLKGVKQPFERTAILGEDEPIPAGWNWDGNIHEQPLEDGSTWRYRQVTTTEMRPTTVVMRAGELTVNTEQVGNRPPGFRTATHEFAHRVEYTSPHVVDLELAFLHRRTTNPATGEREAFVSLYGTSQEQAQPDDFATAYVGKTYGAARAREVFSVGMESIFSGSYGGLEGRGGYKADLDHRNLVLGILATV